VKILFVAPRFHTNQVPFVKALVAAGHEVVFDALVEGPMEDRSVVVPHLVPPSLISNIFLRLRAPANPVAFHAAHTFPGFSTYLERLRALRPDIVVIREPNRPFSLVAALAARLLGQAIVLYAQGPVHAPPRRIRSLARGIVSEMLDAPWYSPVSGDRTLPSVHPRTYYLPFVADLERVQKSSWFAGDRVHLLAIGKFVPRKNHLLLLDAFGELRRRHAVKLTLVGEVSTSEHRAHFAEVERAVNDRGLREDVTVLPNVPFAEVADLYLSHDLFVLPSRKEPAGVSLLEAMAHGLPVVCSTTSGTRWYIEPEQSGFVFRSDDREHLLAVLERAVSDRSVLVSMGARARLLVDTVHHPDAILAAFFSVVRDRRRPVPTTQES
jgi:glycosyltransferase involved in cell wall biosynthesis